MNKIIIIALCFLSVANCESETYKDIKGKINKIFIEHKDECLEKTKVQPELIDKLLIDITVPKNQELKCYIDCALSNANVINEDFTLDVDKLRSYLPNESGSVADDIVGKCKGVGDGDNCSKAYEILRCVYYELKAKFDV